VAQLLAAGQKVRALSRNPVNANLDPRVEVVAGDFNKPETLARAMIGVDRVFALAFGPQTGVLDGSLARAAKDAGVRHIVKLSVSGVGSAPRTVIATWHVAGEKAIRDSGIAWTFVRPGAFMSKRAHVDRDDQEAGKGLLQLRRGKSAVHPKPLTFAHWAQEHAAAFR
jgi:(4-alkanoyl-5-oxo-2,5-dihydrofuran-3-yl)methyl phosphate reductase